MATGTIKLLMNASINGAICTKMDSQWLPLKSRFDGVETGLSKFKVNIYRTKDRKKIPLVYYRILNEEKYGCKQW